MDSTWDDGPGEWAAELAPEWPETPRVPGPPEPDALPVDALPAAMRDHVTSVARSLQVPADLPLLLGLGTLSAALAGKVEVSVRLGWQEPLGLYSASILPPAARKSPTFAAMTTPVIAWEAESVAKAAPRVLAALDLVEVAERRLDTAKKAVANNSGPTEAVERCRIDLERARAQVPPDGRLLAGDITPEAMVQRMAAQGGRLAVLEPEPGPLQLLAGRYSDTARLDELKKAWSGEAILVDRVGRSPIRVPRPALTLALCLQPGVLDALQNGVAFRVEGVMGRVLWCQPPHGLGSRLTGPNVPPLDKRARDRYAGIVGLLCNVESAGADEDGTLTPHVLGLDLAALEILHAYEAEVELDLGDRGRFAGIRDWAGKAVGQSVRVAALLELAARAGDQRPLVGTPIGPWAMDSAVRLMRALSTHALAVLGGIGMDGRTELLQYVLRRAQGLPLGSTLRDLWQAARGRSEIESMDDLAPLVGQLEERGCLRLVEVPREGAGRPPSPKIEIHPSLTESIPTIPTIASPAPGEGLSGVSGDAFGSGADETEDASESPGSLWHGGPLEPEEFSEEDLEYLADERAALPGEARS